MDCSQVHEFLRFLFGFVHLLLVQVHRQAEPVRSNCLLEQCGRLALAAGIVPAFFSYFPRSQGVLPTESLAWAADLSARFLLAGAASERGYIFGGQRAAAMER